ncbi:MAG: methyltransferase domain-containing protein [Thiomicrorhabdus sp.]|nr:methyltransferase domain-containing protein [Thiomicrorhabdus sp.]
MFLKQADGILDLRTSAEYQAGHLKGATWLPWDVLPDSLNELPATPASLFLVGSKPAIETASVFLDLKGYKVNGSLVIEDDKTMQKWAEKLSDQVVSGRESKQLWSPTPLLKEWLNLLEERGINPKALKPRLTALDIGCGGGRDAVFLAKHGIQVLGIDQEARVLKRAKQLASRTGASVKFKCCDLKKVGCFPTSLFDVITVVRYLNRDLFSKIDTALSPGGYLIYQTFAEGAEAFGSPKNPNFILAHDELRKVFSDYQIIVDRIDKLEDGRPVASFIAQKPL